MIDVHDDIKPFYSRIQSFLYILIFWISLPMFYASFFFKISNFYNIEKLFQYIISVYYFHPVHIYMFDIFFLLFSIFYINFLNSPPIKYKKWCEGWNKCSMTFSPPILCELIWCNNINNINEKSTVHKNWD